MDLVRIVATLTASFLASAAFAAAPSGAPSGSTGQCNDGSYSQAAEKKGACRGHKGVKEWFASGADAAAPAKAASASVRTPAAATTVAPSAAAKPAVTKTADTPRTTTPTTATSAKPTEAPTRPVAAGGGSGKVWVNSSTKVYHCQGDRYYGTTKQGEYMTESEAQSKGFHGSRGKGCA